MTSKLIRPVSFLHWLDMTGLEAEYYPALLEFTGYVDDPEVIAVDDLHCDLIWFYDRYKQQHNSNQDYLDLYYLSLKALPDYPGFDHTEQFMEAYRSLSRRYYSRPLPQ